jgi:hypothetical protein
VNARHLDRPVVVVQEVGLEVEHPAAAATTVASLVTCPATALKRGLVVVVAAVDRATTVASPATTRGIAPQKADQMEVEIRASVTTAMEVDTCRVIAQNQGVVAVAAVTEDLWSASGVTRLGILLGTVLTALEVELVEEAVVVEIAAARTQDATTVTSSGIFHATALLPRRDLLPAVQHDSQSVMVAGQVALNCEAETPLFCRLTRACYAL